MRYATVDNWAKYFEEVENIQISGATILKRLKSAEKTAITGRSRIGRILNSYYSESDVREACTELQQNIPQSNESGSLEFEDCKYGTIGYLSKILSIPKTTLKKRIKKAGIKCIKGKYKTGVRSFYPEDKVRSICSDIFQRLPEANKEGFFDLEDIKYGTYRAWATLLSISEVTLVKRISKSKAKGIEGRIKEGNVCVFYTKRTIVELCNDLLDDAPKADESGFIMIQGTKYGSIKAWARFLNVSASEISRMLKNIMTIGIIGRIKEGNICNFYSEPDIRKACKELLDDYPQADQDGFCIISGKKYASSLKWSKYFDINYEAALARLQKKAKSIKCRLKGGQIKNFYSEPDVLSACADLLRARQSSPEASEGGAKRESEITNPEEE